MKNNHKLFIDIAERFAEESHCLSKHVAAIAVKNNRIVCTGINGTPEGTENCDLHWEKEYLKSKFRRFSKLPYVNEHFWEKDDDSIFSDWLKTDEWRELHTKWSTNHEVHAEQNLISEAAQNGINIGQSDIYVTLSPCIHCAKALVSLHPKAVYYKTKYDKSGSEVEDLFKLVNISLIQLD